MDAKTRLQEFTDPFKADEFAQAQRCSACWGLLVKERPDLAVRRWVMVCETCRDDTPGYVSRKWTERRAEVSRAELAEAKLALREAVPWLKSKKTQSAILAELGL